MFSTINHNPSCMKLLYLGGRNKERQPEGPEFHNWTCPKNHKRTIRSCNCETNSREAAIIED